MSNTKEIQKQRFVSKEEAIEQQRRSMNNISVKCDGHVLYVRKVDKELYISRPIDGDDFVIVNYDKLGNQVGVQIIDIFAFDADEFEKHYSDIDAWLRREICRFLHENNKDSASK